MAVIAAVSTIIATFAKVILGTGILAVVMTSYAVVSGLIWRLLRLWGD